MVTSGQTFAEYLAAVYLPGNLRLSPGGAEQLTVAVRVLDSWQGRAVRLKALSAELLTAFLRHYSQTHSPATTNSKRRAILTIWRAAAERGLIQPPGKVSRVQEYTDEADAYSLEEIEAIVSAARRLGGELSPGVERAVFWPALVLVLYDCGSRLTATLSVRCADVSLVRRSLLIRAASQKNKRAQRYLLSDQTTAAVAPLWHGEQELLFPWPHDRSTLRWRYLTAQFRKIIKTAGVPEFRKPFHAIRATSGCLVEANGGDGARHLGHSSRRVFDKHYRNSRLCCDGQTDRLPRPKID